MTGCLLLLAAFGISWIVGFSTISLPIRKWLGGYERDVHVRQLDGNVIVSVEKVPSHIPYLGPFFTKLIECPGCLGFHLGWIFELHAQVLTGNRVVACITMGAAVAASNFILAKLTKIIE